MVIKQKELFNIDYFHQFTKGEGVKVAVLDSEIFLDHLEFEGKNIHYKEFIDSNNPNYHGTTTSSLIVGNTLGFSPDVELYHAKMLSDKYGSGRSWDRALSWVVKQDVDVICMSIGTKVELSAGMKQTLQRIHERGIIVTAPSGNEGKSILRSPANDPRVIAVGGIDYDKKRARMSNKSPLIEAYSLSEDITVANIDENVPYIKKDGTSYANAFVASQLALIISYARINNKNINAREFLEHYNEKNRTELRILDMKKVKKELDIYLDL